MVRKKIKYILSFIVVLSIILSSCLTLTVFAEKDDKIDKLIGDGGTATGVGLATWMMQCYVDGWDYQEGQQGWGAADCSGTIAYYRNAGLGACGITDMMGSAKAKNLPTGGDVNGKFLKTSDMPRVHGIIMHHPGHVGVFLGSQVTLTQDVNGKYGKGNRKGVTLTGNELDNSDYGVGLVLRNMDNAEGSWTDWGFAVGCKYPTKGFVKFNNKVFYYEPTNKGYSEYVVNKTVKVDGKDYKFNDKGECTSDTSGIKFEQTTFGTPSASSGSSNNSSSGTSENSGETSDSESSGGTTAVQPEEESYADKEQLAAERDLTYEEQVRLEAINNDIKNKREMGMWSGIYTFSGLCGILILIYSLILLVAFYIDLFNSFTEKSLLQLLTFGKMYSIGSSKNREFLGAIAEDKKGIVYATHATIWASFCIGVIASAVLMNMQTIVMLFLNIADWFSDLLNFDMN